MASLTLNNDGLNVIYKLGLFAQRMLIESVHYM